MSTQSQYDPDFGNLIEKPVRRRGFRLIEILSTLGILLLLAALFLPAFRGGARSAAWRAMCSNNLKQIALALHNYEQEYGMLPPARTLNDNGEVLHSWRTLILPYLEQQQLYQSIDLSRPWNDPVNQTALSTRVSTFQCPEAGGRSNHTSYLGIVAPGGCFRSSEGRRLEEITDKPSATLMVIEVNDEHAVPWMMPADADEALILSLDSKSKLHHPGGMNVAFVDGSVRFLKATTLTQVGQGLISIAGGELLNEDW